MCQPDAARLGRELRAPAHRDRARARRGRDGVVPARAGAHRLRLRGRVLHGRPAGHRVRAARGARAADRGHDRRDRHPGLSREGAVRRRGADRRRRDHRVRRQAVPRRRRHPLRAALVQGVAQGRDRHARADLGRRHGAALHHRRRAVRHRRRPDRLRDLRGRVGRQPPGHGPRAARRRHPVQSVGEPLRVRQVRRAPALRGRGLARVRRGVPLRQPHGQRGRPRGLRRWRVDRVERRAVRAWPAVLVPRRRADLRGDRHRYESPRAGAARQPPPAPRRRGAGRRAHVCVAGAQARGQRARAGLVGRSHQRARGGVRARCRARPVGLPAQEPRPGLRGLALGRRRLRRVRRAGRARDPARVRRARRRRRARAAARLPALARGARGRRRPRRGGARVARVRLPADPAQRAGHPPRGRAHRQGDRRRVPRHRCRCASTARTSRRSRPRSAAS